MKTVFLTSAVLALMIGGSAPALAEPPTIQLDKDIKWIDVYNSKSASVLIRNNVSDNCWPAPEETVQAVTDEFEASGLIPVVGEGKSADMAFLVDAQGENFAFNCAVAYTVQIIIRDAQYDERGGQALRTSFLRTLWTKRGLALNTEGNISRDISEAIASIARDFLLDRQREGTALRRSIDEQSAPEAQKAWRERFGS